MSALRSTWEEGAAAYRSGLTKVSNPYKVYTEQRRHDAWNAGWEAVRLQEQD